MKPPPGIGEWTTGRFRRWVGGLLETHSDQLSRLERVAAAQNVMVLDLRKEVTVVSAVLARATRPSLPDTASRLAEMAGDNEL